MPAKLGSRDDLGLALTFLRWLKEWQQEDLAAASGVSLDAIQAIEQGRRRQPTLKTLGPIIAALGADLSTVATVVELIQRYRRSSPGAAPQAVGGARSSLPRSRTDLVDTMAAMLRQTQIRDTDGPPKLDRKVRCQQAAELWGLVAGAPDHLQHRLVVESRAFQSIELCEHLCELSLAAAGDAVRDAVNLANMALEVAGRVPGAEVLRARLTGYAGVHLANCLRVAGNDLSAAATAFEGWLSIWRGAESGDPGELNAARVLGLEASLRRAQRRLPEAMNLLDQALTIDRWGETCTLLLAKARALVEVGEFETSIALLEQAWPQVDIGRNPRDRYLLCNMLVLNLCGLGRYVESETRLAELREVAPQLGNRLDSLKVDWLGAKVAAGLERPEEAIRLLLQVREQFLELNNVYDVALVTLELAELNATLGRIAEVKALASESAPLLASQGVHREARQALELFCRAAENERATSGLLRTVIAFLYRSRHDASVRFRPPARGDRI